jgi:hypothetical protein
MHGESVIESQLTSSCMQLPARAWRAAEADDDLIVNPAGRDVTAHIVLCCPVRIDLAGESIVSCCSCRPQRNSSPN